VLNLPLPLGSTVAVYQPLFEKKVMRFIDFQPDLLIVSAGYDANAADPLADMALQPQDYGLFTEYCLQLTSRIVLALKEATSCTCPIGLWQQLNSVYHSRPKSSK